MIDRRAAMAGLAVGAGVLVAGTSPAPEAVVQVRDGRLVRGGDRYPVIGTNLWYAAWLGSAATPQGAARLERELDRLRAIGINNVRLLGGAERSPLRGAVSPAFQNPGEPYSEALLRGLDVALAAIGRRGMTAVVYLNNFWEWSGGMAAYLTCVNGGRFVEAVDPTRPWTDFPDFVAGFYANPRARALADAYVRAVVTRTNSVTGVRYADDPAIMAWQLANEPRPGGTEVAYAKTYPAFLDWVGDTAALIRSLDPAHLVSLGSEGTIGCMGREACVLDAHAVPGIDYVTAHVWPQNWGWVRRDALAETFDRGVTETRAYLDRHATLARRLGKPLVVEEFGFPRDGGALAPGSATGLRDRYYRVLLDAVAAGYRAGGPMAGANFWAWNGEGRARHPDARFRAGDAFLGDPPHEPQGLYGVFDTDAATIAVVRGWARAMRSAARA